jgi:hypothetical protein
VVLEELAVLAEQPHLLVGLVHAGLPRSVVGRSDSAAEPRLEDKPGGGARP